MRLTIPTKGELSVNELFILVDIFFIFIYFFTKMRANCPSDTLASTV